MSTCLPDFQGRSEYFLTANDLLDQLLERRNQSINMATGKSELVKTLDELQAKLRPALKECGFRARGRAFNRLTADGLTEVVQLQTGRFDPPGTTYLPGRA